MPQKAFKANKVQKVKPGQRPKPQPAAKPKTNKLTARKIVEIVAETLQNNSAEGEYDLPSWLIKYSSGPKAYLGLHREFYLPVGSTPKLYPANSAKAMDLFRYQAAAVVSGLLEGGFKFQETAQDFKLCEEC